MHGKSECATMVVFGINEERQLSMNNNWEKLGDEIRKTVQDAVENQNYERLNQMISETLNKAAKSANDTVKNKYNGYKTYSRINRFIYTRNRKIKKRKRIKNNARIVIKFTTSGNYFEKNQTKGRIYVKRVE